MPQDCGPKLQAHLALGMNLRASVASRAARRLPSELQHKIKKEKEVRKRYQDGDEVRQRSVARTVRFRPLDLLQVVISRLIIALAAADIAGNEWASTQTPILYLRIVARLLLSPRSTRILTSGFIACKRAARAAFTTEMTASNIGLEVS